MREKRLACRYGTGNPLGRHLCESLRANGSLVCRTLWSAVRQPGVFREIGDNVEGLVFAFTRYICAGAFRDTKQGRQE